MSEWKYINTHFPCGIYERSIKRIIDITFAIIAAVILSPIIFVVGILVRIKLGSPVIFKQKRPGKNEQIFELYKFRTMTDEKDKYGNLFPDEIRLTKFGKLLRATSLDELPELINIMKGDMSLIGPRPLLVKYLPYYRENERHRHDVRPGLTGLAQVNGRNFINWEQKFKYDIEYVNNITFKNDASIFIETIKKVLKRADVMENSSQVEFKNLDDERKNGNE